MQHQAWLYLVLNTKALKGIDNTRHQHDNDDMTLIILSDNSMSRGIFAYLTRSGNPKKKDDQQKKKKRRWLFRRAESVSSLTDQYSDYPGFGNAAPSFGASPYGDLSPNSFFTETGKLQKDKEMMKKAQNRGGGSRTVEPEVDLTLNDLDLPQSSVLRRPSLYEVFENKGDRKGEPTQTLGPSLVVDDNKGEDKEDDDDDDDDEIASPYEQDSFHQRMDSKASSSSGNRGVIKVSPQATDTEQYSRRQDRKNVRSITEESIGQCPTIMLLIINPQFLLYFSCIF